MPNRADQVQHVLHRRQLRLANGKLYTVHTVAERPPSIEITLAVSTLDDEVHPGEAPGEVLSQERRFVLEEERDGERFYRETPLASLDEARGARVKVITATATREEMAAIARDRGAAFFLTHLRRGHSVPRGVAMPPRRCLYCEQPVEDGSGYHPEWVPTQGQGAQRLRFATPALASARTAAAVLGEQSGVRVRVVDFEMSFGSMVTFMVKRAIASIPAFLILFGLSFIALAIVAALFHVGGRVP